ncbi:pre-mRNA processing factor 3-domain-containing protein [Entophlyctis helioformis]|nr:pre-mRNA processing factor 3-domain-containing protein [Entophlyctis helioformis]
MKRTADGDGSQSSDAAAKRPRTEPLTTQQIQELAAKAKERAALLLQQGQANAVRPPAGPAGSAGLVPGAAAAAANPVRPGANPIRPSMPSANPIRPPAGMPTMANPVRPSMPVTANPVRPVTAAPAASGGSNAVRPGLGAGPSAGAGAAPSMDLIRQQIAAKQEELRRSLAAKNALAAASRPPVQTPLAAAATSVAAALPSAPHDAATRAKGGLNVEFHPVLMAAMGSASSSTASASSTSAASARAKALNRPIFSTVKANVRMQEEEARRLAEEARAAAAAAKEIKIEREVSLDFKDPAKNPYFDPGIKTASAIAPRSRVKRGFQFVTPGKYIEQGTKQRTEAMLEKLKKDIADTIKKSGIEKEIELVSDQSLRTEAPPAVEWWDAKLLPEESYDKHNPDVPYPQGDQLITNLVQHPVPIAPPAEPGAQEAASSAP